MVKGDGRDDRYKRNHGVCSIERASHAGFQNYQVAAFLGEMMQSEGGRNFEECRRMVPAGRYFTKNCQTVCDRLRRDFLAIDTNALSKIHKMRRSVKSSPAARGSKDRIQDRANGALAIRARNVQEGQMLLRIAQSLQQASNILKSELDAELLRGIKPRQRLLVDHFRDGAR